MSVNEAGQETPSAPSSPSSTTTPKWLAGASLVAGVGAVIASSCCVLPLGLAAIGVGAGVFGVLNEVAAWRVTLLFISTLAVASGWGAWWIKRREACLTDPRCAPQSLTQSPTALLIIATAVVILAAGWEHIDPVLLKLIKRSD